MEGVGSPSGQNSDSFLPHLLISAGGITATALALVVYHLIVKYIKKQQERSMVLASQTLQFAKGVEEKVLRRIPILAYSTQDCKLFRVDQSECVICLGELEDGEMVRLLPNCRHAFHVPCIGSWFLGHKTCPFCRSPVVVVSEPESTDGNSAFPISDGVVRNEERLLQRSASSSRVEYLNMPIEEKHQILASGTLKRSFSIGDCSTSVHVGVQNDGEMRKQEEEGHGDGDLASSSSSSRSVKQIDRMPWGVVRSFSQLRMGSRSYSSRIANGILPY